MNTYRPVMSQNNENMVTDCEEAMPPCDESMVTMNCEDTMLQNDENMTPRNLRVYPRYRRFVDKEVDAFSDIEATEILKQVIREPLESGRVHARCWEPYCVIRNLTFSNNSKKAHHIQEFHGGKTNLQIFKCQICCEFFFKTRNLQHHKRSKNH
ncbi:uncharacterized protein LOC135841167 [Planococcus citri]|uniref:uncharacterized protein LOC135841167 n=1 Tax=Planococcus citri TaxID=170843 RepID=UPI0031F75704